MSPDQYTERYLQRMITDVKLTNEQVECLRPMMEEFSEKLSIMRQKAFAEARNVLVEMDRRIERDLTPEQVALYRQMQERDRALWQKRPGPASPEKHEAPAPRMESADDPRVPKPLPPPPATPGDPE